MPSTPAELHCRAGGLVLLAVPEWGRLPSLVAQQALVLLWALQGAQPHNLASTPSHIMHRQHSMLPDM